MTSLILSRHRVIEYSTPVYYNTYHYTVAKPKPLPRYTNLVYPFNLMIWLSLLFMLVMVTLTLLLLELDKSQKIFGATIFAFAQLVQESLPISWLPKRSKVRWFAAAWMIMSLFIVRQYQVSNNYRL